jgi:hypothetical protein
MNNVRERKSEKFLKLLAPEIAPVSIRESAVIVMFRLGAEPMVNELSIITEPSPAT